MSKKAWVFSVTVILMLCCIVGSSLAWLKVQTDPVLNTFTAGDINIELKETTTDYKMIPGNKISKDPNVTVKADSEPCWLFVKVEQSENFVNFMTFDIAEGWTELTAGSGIYYRDAAASNSDQEFGVLKDNQVTVLDTVTKEMLRDEKFTEPTLTFTAYAVQKDNFTDAAAAWTAATDMSK